MENKKKGRPATGRKVITRSFCMAPELLDDLVSEAERLGISASSLLSNILYDRYNGGEQVQFVDGVHRCGCCGEELEWDPYELYEPPHCPYCGIELKWDKEV